MERLPRLMASRATGLALAAAFCSVVACQAARAAAMQTAPAPTIVLFAVPHSPESTMALTRRALGEIGGTLQAIQWTPKAAILSTRYRRNVRGPGTREVAIVAAVGRETADTLNPLTIVEVRAWAMDSSATRREIGAAINSGQSNLHRPRPLSRSDSTDWESVELVLRLLQQHGGRPLP